MVLYFGNLNPCILNKSFHIITSLLSKPGKAVTSKGLFCATADKEKNIIATERQIAFITFVLIKLIIVTQIIAFAYRYL